MLGQVLIHVLFAAALTATGFYAFALRGNEQAAQIGRMLFRLTAIGIVIAFLGILWLVFNHRFEYHYIWNYSSRELQAWYLFAAGYAGQEGSFMLWTLWVALLGVALSSFGKKKGMESEIMVFYSLILSFLLLLLVIKNPFAFVWETFAKDGVAEGFVPQNGKGLNPLLHNVWITIHPPILFTGFAAMSAPFALAMAGLLKRDYQNWVRHALPWTLYATAILGFGIMLGGFWAYETLGWGGFWAWDPVENSSLIPWLVSAALVHTMLIQKKTGGLVKTNVVLASLAFILVLYSTFLTRSGVLGDTSVHSFVDPGMFAYIMLIAFMSTFLLLALYVMYRRKDDLMFTSANFSMQSREFLLSMGSALLLGSAIIVFIGTSWPLFAEILKQPKVAIDPAFYNSTHLPLVILIMVFNAISLIARWNGKTIFSSYSSLLLPLGLAIAGTITSIIMGVTDFLYVLLTFSAWFALMINLELAFKVIRARLSSAGAYFSHAGIALLLIGVVWTSRYSVMEHAQLVQGIPTKVLGYTLTYKGKERIEKEYADREKYRFHIDIEKDGTISSVAPMLFWSDFNKRQSAFLEPGIDWSLGRDVYVSPKATGETGGIPTLTLSKDQKAQFPTDSTRSIRFLAFDMSRMRSGPDSAGKIYPSAIVRLFSKNDSIEISLRAGMNMQTTEMTPEPVQLPGTNHRLSFAKLLAKKGDLANSQIEIAFEDISKPVPPKKEVFTVEVSIKPLINLVWLGVILMVTGFFVSIARHKKDLM
ncbi:MAG: cytochrome c-type biogenesis CcmF C-terminal domain-containing protein [Candidatus Kapaibacteriota bacterium]|jgi:cytochrome c-type biogenesis protein CcmF